MPTISSGDKVLVTGANGYIAIWIVQKLLEKGYYVRAAVRAPGKAKHLQDLFKSYSDKLEFAYVPDIGKEGAFDEAAKGVDAILHTASPATLATKNPRDVIEPAVNGTVNVLKSALNAGSGLKRVVITSSIAAMASLPPPEGTFSEMDWNDAAIKHVEEKGESADPNIVYCASKTLAEKAAWDFVKKNKEKISWDLVAIHPPLVFGPSSQELSSKEGLNASMQIYWRHVLSEGQKPREELATGLSWVDVRDLAEGHIVALEKEEAQGQRIVVSAGEFIWQEWVDLASKHAPSFIGGKAVFKGYPDLPKVYRSRFDCTKEKEVLGLKYYSMEETTKVILKEFAERGW
ncbi:D-lactaldehyde dehydrogenase [Coprinopsis sp. MPI-PUGE-AT-0042]|nr:D-lactaldehyde dehydrogenase [Coprinopsis sp. MPI-PUGE-AT-0042]